MQTQLSYLYKSLEWLKKSGRARTLEKAVNRPEARHPLSPWATWMLLCLVRHHFRQQWVAEVIAQRLGDPGHRSPTGLVPGLTQWEYYFHGIGFCLTNRITGELIDVDFFDGSADWFDSFFYVKYLKSLKHPPFAERRLIDLHRSLRSEPFAINELLDAELLETGPGTARAFRVHPDCLALADSMPVLEQAWNDQQERWIAAAAIGDWILLANELPIGHPRRETAIDRAKKLRDERFGLIRTAFGDFDTLGNSLAALSDLDHPELRNFLNRALAFDPPDGTTTTAMKLIASRQDEDWCEPVYSLWRRMDCNGQSPQEFLWIESAKYLLLRNYRAADIIAGLQRVEGSADAALLALEFAPECALDLFRRALRSADYPRCIAAAALAILDEEWCQRELAAVLEESDDQQATAECRAGLEQSRSPKAHEIAARWMENRPHEPKSEKFVTMSYNMVKHNMEVLHDRVLPLRRRIA